MKFAALVLFWAALIGPVGLPACGQDSNHVQWVAQTIKTMQTVKVGMTRAQLERVFVTEGGLSTTAERTYVYRGCPYFKVDVQFETDPANPNRESDKITRISKPYLDWPTSD